MKLIFKEVEELERIHHLIDDYYFRYILESQIFWKKPFRSWVDKENKPETGLFVCDAKKFHLIGNSENKVFNTKIQEIIRKEIIPELLKVNSSYITVFYFPNTWESKINDFFNHKMVVKKERILLELEKLNIKNWREKIPKGYVVEQINSELLMRKDIKNIESLINEIKEMWIHIDTFLSTGFGFVLLKENKELITWCTAEYVSNRKCGVGIATVEPINWGKGFATLTAAAFVEYCIINKIQAFWDSLLKNSRSIRVAKKVGFAEKSFFSILLGSLDEAENYFLKGDNEYEKKNYTKAVINYEIGLGLTKPKDWMFYNTACLWALCGDKSKAYIYLKKAIHAGWDNLHQMNISPSLECLHNTNEWKELIEELENYKKSNERKKS